MLVAGLSTGHIIGLAAMAAIFIAFALISSFVAPRKWPDFPGKGLSVYIVVCFVLFALMIGAVELFAVEEEEAQGAEVAGEVQGEGTQGTVIEVGETEWRIELPSGTAKTLAGGEYTFIAENEGKQPHNLVVDGPEVDNVRTKTIPPGGHAELHVKLGTGNYKLYCSIPGHEQLGMVAHLAVG